MKRVCFDDRQVALARAAPFEAENSVPALDTSFYEGRLPIHSSDGSFSTQLFTMDPATGAYTFGYDTGTLPFPPPLFSYRSPSPFERDRFSPFPALSSRIM